MEEKAHVPDCSWPLPGYKVLLCPRTVGLLGPLLFSPTARTVLIHRPHFCPLSSAPILSWVLANFAIYFIPGTSAPWAL